MSADGELPLTPSAARLREWIADAARRSAELVWDLDEARLMGPYLPTVNPLRWEIAHASWFYSRWVIRDGLGRPPVRADEDSLFDSIAIGHVVRWYLPLPSIEDTKAYVGEAHRQVLEALDADPSERVLYLAAYALFHEDMHTEAFTYARQTLAYPRPQLTGCARPAATDFGPLGEDAQVPGGRFRLGAQPGDGFAFDNEKWAHEARVEPFAIARTAVSQGEFAAFVDDGGYDRPALWSAAGWGWRSADARTAPRFWRRGPSGWERRWFDTWEPLDPTVAMLHVSAYEAEAYCTWAGRRLPTELEWEVAAAGQPDGRGGLAPGKRRYPWGDEAPDETRANLDARALGPIDVGALPAGDSAFGCRQMLGNVWEWTSSMLEAYPGFEVDMYREYSEPWFGSHRVLRGGAYTSRARLMRNTWRNFYTPNRDDVMTGFRTCAR
jgi:iron(II)-dependent oxidoreductase